MRGGKVGKFRTFKKYLKKHKDFTAFIWADLSIKLKGDSEWLLFNANSAILQLYHGENKLIFNEMMMGSALF